VRTACAFLLLAALGWMPAYAGSDLVPFSQIHMDCVQVGDVTFGPQGKWPTCRITRSHFFSAIDLLDFYQVQYCLGKEGEECDRRALLVFSNRAYTPVARLELERLDPGGTQYDNPLVVQVDKASVLVIGAHVPGADNDKKFYLWQKDHWAPIDARGWLRDLSKRLPKGLSVRKGVLPDAETMSAHVPLYRVADADCCPTGGVADVQLGVAKGRFTVQKVKVGPKAE
jgi:hypothetical protein